MIEPVARIYIELQDIQPRIWRRVDVPLTSHLLTLHNIIQIAFGWTDSHLFQFSIGNRDYGPFRARRTSSGASSSIGRRGCG